MTSKKRGLGKGLSALISEDTIIEDNISQKESIVYLKLGEIIANENQPRIDFNENALIELSESIKTHGLIQPILVRKKGKKYEIIAGERRWRASKLAKLNEIPCLIKDIDTEISAKYALIENIQREDLNPIEEALGYKKLIGEYKLTQEELSKELGKSRPYISNTIRLLNLEKEVIDYIAKGQLTAGHGKVLLGIKDNEIQLNVAKEIIKNNLNVRETEELLKPKEKSNNSSKKKTTRDPQVIDIEENLMRILGTKVNLIPGRKKGKIEIEYYNLEDLDRIMEILGRES